MKTTLFRTFLLALALTLFTVHLSAQVTVAGSTGANGTYAQLNLAFTAINGAAQTGNNIVVTITASTTETASAVLNAGAWASLKIYPTAPTLSISGNLAAPLIDLNGADNVTIDGRVNQAGVKALTITNINNSVVYGVGISTIRFINDATANTVKYCTLKGSTMDTSSGVIFFSTTTGTTGNDNNTIDNNNITNSANANRPINAVYSLGTGYANSGNTISNNNIYDFLNPGANSSGIKLDDYNTAWNITGNSLYETTSFIPTNVWNYYAIYVVGIHTNNITVSGNSIGGSAPLCAGTPWTKTAAFANQFSAIWLDTGGPGLSNIQGNTIQNFAWNDAVNWYGIYLVGSGNVNVGTVTGNTIGAAIGTGSITLTNSFSGGTLYGIYDVCGGTVDCRNNSIGSIITANTTAGNGTYFYGIYNNIASPTISYNIIGSSTTPNSINATSTGAQDVYGIFCSYGSDGKIINGNTIANLTNGNSTSTGLINGIKVNNYAAVISNNIIHDLTIANTNTGTSVSGIDLQSPGSSATGNTIYNLSNTNASFAGNIYGIITPNQIGIGQVCSGNFIHSLSVTGATSTAATITGILVAGRSTYSNNIINLGGATKTTLYGIYTQGSYICNLYHNTVYLGGTLASGSTNKSYCVYRARVNDTCDIRNNLFTNARSTTGGASLHYAIALPTNTKLTCDYNNYWVSGSGGVLGYMGSIDKGLLVDWQIATAQDASSSDYNPLYTNAGSTVATDYKPTYKILAGVTGTGITTDYAGTTRATPPTIGAWEISGVYYPVEVYISNVLQAGYKAVWPAFAAINAGTHVGALDVRINAGTSESASAVLNASGGSASYTGINMYPTTTGLRVMYNRATPLIDLNGADNVTIDGRVNATGSAKDLIINNINTSATAGTSTIRFINDASGNTVKYCTIKGSSLDAASGVVFFSTAGTGMGNDNNTIDNNDITNAANANRPLNAVYSLGTTAKTNSSNTISNNNIYDFLNRATASNGINIAGYNTTWNVTANSLYETASFVPTAAVAYTPIYVSAVTAADIIVSGNYIGGSARLCTGAAWTKTAASTNSFRAIRMGTGPAVSVTSSVQGNTIKNFAWSDAGASDWYGIYISATSSVNVGTAIGNTIGAPTGVITVTGGTSSNVYCIYISSGSMDCQNNVIESIVGANAAAANGTNIYGIANNANNTTIRNNTIGSTTTANSINATSASTGAAQYVIGIFNVGQCAISGNTIAKLTNGTTNPTAAYTGVVNGIYSVAGTNVISNNTVRDLTIANANTAGDYTASAGGIVLSGLANVNTVTGNTIFNLSNTYASFAGKIQGIYFTGSTGANVCSGNFIHSLSVTGASSTTASILGINAASGATTYSNNIINLGGTTKTTLYGIYDTGAASQTCNLYHNTVYLGGTLASGSTNKSYCLYSAAASNTRNYRNNLFTNARSTTAGASLHYAISLTANTTLTCDYNDYWVSGTGGVLGSMASVDKATLADWKAATPQDVSSNDYNPLYTNAGSTVASDYIPTYKILAGITGTGITTDYAGITRTNPPTKGAWEISGVYFPVEVYISNVFQAGYGAVRPAFAAINAGTHTGALDVRINASVVESASAVLNASGGSANYTSVNVFPTFTGLSVIGNLAAPLIDLNGADNVTIDGRVNATGTDKDLVITNTSNSSGTSTIRFINDATANTVKYCTLKGSATVTGGIIFFSTATTTGNNNNIIDNNDLTNAADANRPSCGIYSNGTAGKSNSGISITNNNIYNFMSRGSDSRGIYFGVNTTACTITGNSLYETATLVPTVNAYCYPIFISSLALGNSFNVIGNSIGGTLPSCGGGPWTKSNAFTTSFYGIYLNIIAGGTPSVVQNNTIRNMAWNATGAFGWNGMFVAGAGSANMNGNTIGATTGTGSITVSDALSGGVYPLVSNCTGSTAANTVQNNTVGSITLASSDATKNNDFVGVYVGGGSPTVNNNLIGSATTANSINSTSASTASAQLLEGIESIVAVTVSGNTIANLTNGTTNGTVTTTGSINGIYASNAATITDNIIRDLTISNANTSVTNTSVYSTVSVAGIALSGAFLRTVTGNTIYNLSNSYASFAGNVHGIYFTGSTGANVCSGNFIHSLSITGASSTTASILGINAASGATTYSNNIINLGGTTKTTLYGIYETGAASNNNSLFHNTVYIGGAPTAGANSSYALWSNASTNTRDFRNNIFSNSRSNAGATGKHYAAYFNYAVATGLTLGYNDYYAPGTGGVLGYYNAADVTALPLVAGLDASSLKNNPLFPVPGSTTAVDYKPSYHVLVGNTISGITTDYAGTIRTTPFTTMGAFEGPLAFVEVYKGGLLQAEYLTLKTAFDAVNAGTHTGALDVRINMSTTEPASAVLNASSGSASYTGINVYPTKTGLSVTGNLATPLIDLNGADNVTIDGRVNGIGAVKDLTISNASVSNGAGTSTIRFINDATTNTVKYCTVKGSTLDAAGGMIFFSTTTGTTGNDGNTIDNNNITNSADANRPLCAVWSVGTAARENSGNTISNNAIYDFLNRGVASQGIYFGANTTSCAVTNNSLYETASFVPTAAVAYYPIYINNTAGTGFTVTSNYIGGQAAACGGSAWTKTNASSNAFNGIYMNVGKTPISNAQNNTIKNFAWSNAAATPWFGIYVAGGKVDTSGLYISRGI